MMMMIIRESELLCVADTMLSRSSGCTPSSSAYSSTAIPPLFNYAVQTIIYSHWNWYDKWNGLQDDYIKNTDIVLILLHYCNYYFLIYVRVRLTPRLQLDALRLLHLLIIN